MKILQLLLLAMLLVPLALPAQQETPDWKPAVPGYQYAFPRDHGQHPEHKIEWWYFTGNLHTTTGPAHRFGYQLTFFRIGATPATTIASPWALRDVWMAHFAITEIDGKKYHHADRLNRAGPGLAGATPTKVWNEDWHWEAMTDSPDRFTLQASEPGFAIDLRLTTGKPHVIHGASGISQKGVTPGNASHYYSLPRMPTEGTLTIGSTAYQVAGSSWMDHEFGTSFLEPGTTGWDWFSAQLSDGSELMLFQLRSSKPEAPTNAAGTLIHPNGSLTSLTAKDIQLTPASPWSAPGGAAYPQVWQIRLPNHQLNLECRSLLPNQEFRANAIPGLDYWEGAVEYTGQSGSQPINGTGYLEMTGYSGRPMTVWFGGAETEPSLR